MTAQPQSTPERQPNRLAGESSPYLLQHAHNPVDWYPWGEEALQRARTEDKPILVSIGYSACHWCHVMERECFENEALARLMNEHFVCIKVDREERPDVDAIYMDAIQAMGIRGGWPLNVFLTPDTKPFYGGTYFPPQDWGSVLTGIAEHYRTSYREKIQETADQFAQHIAVSDSRKYGLTVSTETYSTAELDGLYEKLAARFDREHGGTGGAPKFPMPGVWLFLLRYYQITQRVEVFEQLKLTLDRMAFGGIYDQVGGGFARYSVDAEWFAPHFEKMLYDNGQLISLYSEAFAALKDDLYREIAFQSVEFVRREMTSPEGGFYSALDADSEGIEGRFYVWTEEEWRRTTTNMSLAEDMTTELFEEYYNLLPGGNWEHGYNILHRTLREEEFARLNALDPLAFKVSLQAFNQELLARRAERIRPGLDDKILCSWNGLMLKGLVDAFRVFGEISILDLALQNAVFLRDKMRNGPQLYHVYKNGRATVTGYLDDYAFVIDAYVALYEATFAEAWLEEARVLTRYALDNFFDETENLFFFTDRNAEKLIARKKELFDNVVPASNSAMALNLHRLGLLLDKPEWSELSDKMLSQMKKLVLAEPQFLANWACLFAYRTVPTAEIAIVGPDAQAFRQEIDQMYYPNKVLAGTAFESDLPLLRDREALDDKTTVYVCYNRACQLPVFTVNEAMAQVMGVG
ncbi:MAG: thioredoxin domain-containing protein [Cytophagales bacterium]|nr:thioredoxin domain-containing protein [Cytophagales bacterium]